MGIYFRDILLIRISRGTNICVQCVFDKKILIMIFYPIFNSFSSMEGNFFFFLKIKRINNANLFSEPSLIIFTEGGNNSDHDCNCIYHLFCYMLYITLEDEY